MLCIKEGGAGEERAIVCSRILTLTYFEIAVFRCFFFIFFIFLFVILEVENS